MRLSAARAFASSVSTATSAPSPIPGFRARAADRNVIEKSESLSLYWRRGLRTPIGRYAGRLARPRRRLAACNQGMIDRNRASREDLDTASRLRQPGRRGQSQPRPNGGPARRPARQVRRRDPQPVVRLGHGRGGDGGAGHPRLRSRYADRRRLGEHEPRALRHGQGDQRLRPQRRDVRHDDRLALRQSQDEARLWRRHDAETAENVV